MSHKKKGTKNKKTLKDFSKNYWAISTVILAVLLIATLAMGMGNYNNAAIGKSAAAQKILDFAKGQGINATVVNSTEQTNFYQVTLSIQGKEIPVYVTKDGKSLAQLIPLTIPKKTQTTTTPSPTKIPKTDKPKVDLFVMAYCPYGTQAEKGIIPAINTLGDKIDFNIKFVYYSMHGKKEIDENTRQYCIQKEQKDKYIPYLSCFLEAGDYESCLTKEAIDTAKLNSCISKADKDFDITKNYDDKSSWLNGQYPKFDIDKTENEAYKVGGSPTLVINGVQSNAGRNSASYLAGICAAFNKAPEECNTELSTTSPGTGFGYSTTQVAATTAQCG